MNYKFSKCCFLSVSLARPWIPSSNEKKSRRYLCDTRLAMMKMQRKFLRISSTDENKDFGLLPKTKESLQMLKKMSLLNFLMYFSIDQWGRKSWNFLVCRTFGWWISWNPLLEEFLLLPNMLQRFFKC